MKPAAHVAASLLTLVAIGHALRLLFTLEVIVGGVLVPFWVSALAVVVAGGLAVALWREQDEGSSHR